MSKNNRRTAELSAVTSRKPKDTRTRVLDAALAVYEREGHAGFGVHMIVAKSRVSLGSIYHHFGSMDGVAAALYARSMAALLDHISAALRRVRSLKGGVQALVRAYLSFARSERPAMLFIHAASYASFLKAHSALIAQSKGERLETIRLFLTTHAAAGELVTMPLALLDGLLLGPVAELTRRWLAGDESFDLDQAARLLPARIYCSLASPRARLEGALVCA